MMGTRRPRLTSDYLFCAAWRTSDRRPATTWEVDRLAVRFYLDISSTVKLGSFQARVPVEWEERARLHGRYCRVHLIEGECFTICVDDPVQHRRSRKH